MEPPRCLLGPIVGECEGDILGLDAASSDGVEIGAEDSLIDSATFG